MRTRSGNWPDRLPLRPVRPISIRFARRLPRAYGQEVHAATDLRRRLVVLDAELRTRPSEFRRIATHELFHFAWIRLGNPGRREFEEILAAQWFAGRRGELGWSAEWRKSRLHGDDVAGRSRRWREYVCEAFCDTAAWLYAAVPRHPEFTLSSAARKDRKRWFDGRVLNGPFPI